MTEVNFFQFLFSGSPDDSYLAVTEYAPKLNRTSNQRFTKTHFFEQSKYRNAEKIAVQHGQRSNVYIRLSVLKDKPDKGRGKKEDTLGAHVLWVDIDIHIDPLESKQKTQQAFQQALRYKLQQLHDFQFRPSWVNCSGHGLHAYWKLDTFTTDTQAIERRNAWLAKELGGDHCWNITQILRVPGTLNFKDSDPLEVYAVEGFDEFAAYSIEEFGEADIIIKFDTSFEEEELPSNFPDCLPEKLKARIVNGEGAKVSQRTGEVDKSENDWHCALRLFSLWYSSGQILTAMTNPNLCFGIKGSDHINYATYTIAKALEQHNAEQAENSLSLKPKSSQTSDTPSVPPVRMPIDSAGVGQDLEEPLLAPILDPILFYSDPETGSIMKRRLMKGLQIVEPAVMYLLEKAYKFYISEDDGLRYIVTPEGRVLNVNKEDEDFDAWIYQITGFTSEEKEHKILRAGLIAAVHEHGLKAKVVPWGYLNHDTWTFYVLVDDAGRTVLKCNTHQAPLTVPNGTDRIVLLPSSIRSNPLEYNKKTAIRESMQKFVDMFHSYLAADDVTCGILTCFALAVPLAYGLDIQTLPLLHLTGPTGGGKSATMGLLTTWLYGKPKLMTITTASAYRVAAREMIIPFDDYEKLDQDVQRFVLTASTGATRMKSGKGVSDVVTQQAHVLMALTSINHLEEETARRRTFVVHIDKDMHPKTCFTETHWTNLARYRSYLWSGYANWLSSGVLPDLAQRPIQAAIKEAESYISVPAFRGLAGFMVLMWLVGQQLQSITNRDILGLKDSSLKTAIVTWSKTLALDDVTEIEERDSLIIGLQHVFESAKRGPEGEILQARYIPNGHKQEEYTEYTKVIQTLLRDKDFRVHAVDASVLSELECNRGGQWFGLEGSTTEWHATLRIADRRFPDISAKALGWRFKNHAEQHAQQFKSIGPGLHIEHLSNYGPGKNSRGWRVTIRINQLA